MKDLSEIVQPATHEFACRHCTAFIRSKRKLHKASHFGAWVQRVEEWLRTHTCGRDRGDGVRDTLRFRHASLSDSSGGAS